MSLAELVITSVQLEWRPQSEVARDYQAIQALSEQVVGCLRLEPSGEGGGAGRVGVGDLNRADGVEPGQGLGMQGAERPAPASPILMRSPR